MQKYYYAAPNGETAFTTPGQPVPTMGGKPMTRVTEAQYNAREEAAAAAIRADKDARRAAAAAAKGA